jgi:hypothetical protein
MKRKELIGYGGMAINMSLPKDKKFYRDNDVPDYDFFSHNALEETKKLADIYYKKGFTDVEAKAGQHHGTYKVFVNFIPVADITQIPKEIFDALKKDSIRVAGILYAPPNFLRMSMYLELSRPAGDISRWEKVLKRLTLLNKHYPLTSINCHNTDFQREMSNRENEDEIYENVKNTLINQGVVFFGGYAITLYSQYMPKNLQKKLEKFPDFDVLSNDPETTAEIVKERLKDINIHNVKIIKRKPIGEIVPLSYEIKVGIDTIAFIYKPIACHSYNIINIHGEKVKVATIDTMLSFYLAFLYADKSYFDKDRMLCMSTYLFEVEQKNKLEQKGLLKRFSLDCYGKQPTMEEMREEKARKYTELNGSKNPADKKEFERWFFKYSPANDSKRKGKNNKPKEEVRRERSITPTKTIVLQNNVPSLGKSKRRIPKKRSTQKKGEPYAKRSFYFGKRK